MASRLPSRETTELHDASCACAFKHIAGEFAFLLWRQSKAAVGENPFGVFALVG
jgi:hypothetical protein